MKVDTKLNYVEMKQSKDDKEQNRGQQDSN